MMLKGYETENQKLMKRNREVEAELKSFEGQRQSEQAELKEYKLKVLKAQKGVFVEEDNDEVDIGAKNIMGHASVSQKQLADLYAKLKEFERISEDAKRDLTLQSSTFTAQYTAIKDEKAKVDKQLIETECLLSDKDR